MTRYFISGHIDVLQSDFNEHYKARIDAAISEPDSTFVIGDAAGIDTIAQEYLAERINCNRIAVYSSKHGPRNNPHNLNVISGFANHTSKDVAMTNASDVDILWIRSEEETRALYGSKYRPGRISGTEKNQLRRQNANCEVANLHNGGVVSLGGKKKKTIQLPV